jgi:hypothetical protein
MQYLKWAIILIVVYYLYTRYISKENYDLVSPTSDPAVTNKTQLKPGVFYRKGTLKEGVKNTINISLNGGQNCIEFPPEIYIPVAPVDAVCDLGTKNIKAYSQITETSAACPLVNGVPTKTLNKIADIAAFNRATTTTPAQYGGRDCFTQKNNFLNYIELFPCTSPIAAICDLTDARVYDGPVSISSETRAACPNNIKTLTKKSPTILNTLTTSGGATTTAALNSGTDCATQAASLPTTKSISCTNPIAAVCDLTDARVYDTGVAVSAETRATCPNNMKTITKKSPTILNSLVANGGATNSTALNSGTDCSTQAASLPATKTMACTNPIPAECQGGDFTGIISNVNSNYTIDETVTKLGSSW